MLHAGTVVGVAVGAFVGGGADWHLYPGSVDEGMHKGQLKGQVLPSIAHCPPQIVCGGYSMGTIQADGSVISAYLTQTITPPFAHGATSAISHGCEQVPT